MIEDRAWTRKERTGVVISFCGVPFFEVGGVLLLFAENLKWLVIGGGSLMVGLILIIIGLIIGPPMILTDGPLK